jgi:hypothetical protein
MISIIERPVALDLGSKQVVGRRVGWGSGENH